MADLTEQDLLRWRLNALRLSGARLDDPAAVVEHLLCVQGENVGQGTWALGTRCGADAATVSTALDEDVLRTHVLRTTWHFVRPDDVGWLLDLCRARLLPLWTRQLRAAGLDADDVQRGVRLVERVLTTAGGHLTRPEVAAALADAGLPLTGMTLGHLLGYAETVGLVCSGARRGEHTYALLDERAPHRRRLDREEALAEIAGRYAVGHGPFTEKDLAYWATLTLRDVRAGIAAAGLESLKVEGSTYWYTGEPMLGELHPRAHLLHIFDESYRGFQDSRTLLDAEGLLAKGREGALGMVLVDGQIVGSTKRTVGAREVRFDVTTRRDLRPDEQEAVAQAAGRYADFLDREPVVRVGAG